ncbi:DUF1499 domain-containing protein [Synechococcus sp. BS56D]|uniref:DUF1499 domain-containing protein n=1 Tax=Synechococcus sp. BS56D TaxID=2055944 RepID=UPI00103A02C0|nr:DUF1499 domain-containing protein [Synechococcus sp. BS56D]TCD58728.1 DUF1499 domain-containing protein [Synechococcus sp. BS56D]
MDSLLRLTLPMILGLLHLIGPVPADLGVHQGQLSPCTSSAHCARQVWSVSDPQQTLNSLAAQLSEAPRTVVEELSNDYLHATCSSRLFGFVDDLELYADQDNQQLQARSVSRLGDSDLGVNARRLEDLHQQLSS